MAIMICLPLLHFWLAAFLGQVLPLYLWWPQEYPRLAKLEETEIFYKCYLISILYPFMPFDITLMGHMSWIQMKRPQSLMYQIRKASEMMVQMTTSQG